MLGLMKTTKSKLNHLVKKFDFISVREESGIKLVGELIDGNKREVELVVDPTFLLNKDDYSEIINNSSSMELKTPKLFCYILDENDEKSSIIDSISNYYENDCLIINPSPDKEYKPVEEWLKGFRDSEFVITDSFHGLAFSIINNKDFVVFVNYHRGLSRMKDLLNFFGIKDDRLIYWDKGNIGKLSNLERIDWKSVNNKLDVAKKHSSNWLLNILTKKR
jgi:hypothetical protein